MNNETTLRERGALLDELGQIVQSMRNLAMAELQRVGKIRPVQLEARETVAAALKALGVRSKGGAYEGGTVAMPEVGHGAAASRKVPVSWLVIGAERGFCGAFNAQLLAAIQQACAEAPAARVYLASARLARLAEGWTGAGPVQALRGCAALDEADVALDEWLPMAWQAAQAGGALWLMHVGEQGVVRQHLWPPMPWQPDPRHTQPMPMSYVPHADLHAALTRQACRLELQAALHASLEQENRWRLSQMQRAHDHLDELRRQLRQRYAALRQANITNELETLASSGSAAGAGALGAGGRVRP